MDSVRTAIKTQTDPTHRRLDDAFGQLDLASFAGYTTFLRAHHHAYAALSKVFQAQGGLSKTILAVQQLLERDLSRLRVQPSAPAPTEHRAAMHPLGAHYVLAGSHFGKRVLLKRWSRSADARVLASACYLKSDLLQNDWRGVLDALSETSSNSPDAAAIIESAQWTFELFGISLTRARESGLEVSCESA